MKKTSETIIFFGNERLATGVTTTAPVLSGLIEAGYHIAAVVSHYEGGQSRNVRTLEVKDIAEKHNIPVLLPNKPADIIEQLHSYTPTIGVLVAYGKIVPQTVIDIFPKGIINIHPSLLPLHRGPTPLESVMLHGETKTGVSVMQLVKAMDAGPVYAQSEVELTGQESKQDLATQLSEVGCAMLLELLPGILDGTVVALPQDDTRATYDNLIDKKDGIIDWHKPAELLERQIRAFADWPKSRTELGSKPVVITKASVMDEQNKPGTVILRNHMLIVGCGINSLCIERLKPASKSEMDSAAFLAGYKQLLT